MKNPVGKWSIFSGSTALALGLAGALVRPTSAEGWSALIQAIGSIAAIVAALLISRDQGEASLRAERRHRATAQADALGVPVAISHYVLDQFHYLCEELRRPERDWGADPEQLFKGTDRALKHFNEVPLEGLPSAMAVTAVLTFQDEVRFALEQMHQYARIRRVQGLNVDDHAAMAVLQNHCQDAHNVIKTLWEEAEAESQAHATPIAAVAGK